MNDFEIYKFENNWLQATATLELASYQTVRFFSNHNFLKRVPNNALENFNSV
jgi:hypothetical protein